MASHPQPLRSAPRPNVKQLDISCGRHIGLLLSFPFGVCFHTNFLLEDKKLTFLFLFRKYVISLLLESLKCGCFFSRIKD